MSDVAARTLAERRAALARRVRSEGAQAAALVPSGDLAYFTGLWMRPTERATIVLVLEDGLLGAVHPEVERDLVRAHLPDDAVCVGYEDAQGPEDAVRELVARLNLDGATVTAGHEAMRLLEARLLTEAGLVLAAFPLEQLSSRLRSVKSEGEIDALREAVAVAERSLDAVVRHAQLGMRERDIAALVVAALVEGGSEALPKAPVVTIGARTALPHASSADTMLARGDLLMIDTGARVRGMASDVTRTFVAVDGGEAWAEVHAAVAAGVGAALAEIRAGVPMRAIDQAARRAISDAGFGRWFVHRVGHGIGIEGHEAPYLTGAVPLASRLEEGMTLTVEPGIYLPGRGGIRIEENVVVRADGVEVLTTASRALVRVGHRAPA